MAEEGLTRTDNDKIFVGKPIAFDTDRFLVQLGDLMEAAYRNVSDMKARVSRIVPTYHPEGINEKVQMQRMEELEEGGGSENGRSGDEDTEKGIYGKCGKA